ncbi:MAG: hypothetical protein P8X42_05235 [Calditrichaceae bacterium]
MMALKRLAAGRVLLGLLLGTVAARAEDLLMVRSRQAFPEAMITLQNSIDKFCRYPGAPALGFTDPERYRAR